MTLSRSSTGTTKFGIEGCDVCSQTASARPVIPWELATLVKLGALEFGDVF